ncbi:MAG TPA: hypothetical protein VM638_01660 [Actinomycetota bacterium]|nr:hypothetical protein [Actinomycetota bacterium]
MLVAGLLVLGAGYASAAARIRVKAPAPGICTGETITLGVRKVGTRPSYTVTVFRPNGTKMWSRSGTATTRWKTWNVTLPQPGTYTTKYVGYKKRWTFQTVVTNCATLSMGNVDSAVLALENAAPGDAVEACVRVAYSGVPATVSLYGTTQGTGLDAYLELSVTRGSMPAGGEAGSCEGFVEDPTDYLGHGDGVMYRGSLQAFPDHPDAGLADPVATAPAVWADGEAHAYRLRVELGADDRAQGRSASQRFIWGARPA